MISPVVPLLCHVSCLLRPFSDLLLLGLISPLLRIFSDLNTTCLCKYNPLRLFCFVSPLLRISPRSPSRSSSASCAASAPSNAPTAQKDPRHVSCLSMPRLSSPGVSGPTSPCHAPRSASSGGSRPSAAHGPAAPPPPMPGAACPPARANMHVVPEKRGGAARRRRVSTPASEGSGVREKGEKRYNLIIMSLQLIVNGPE